ncbi:MAG: hypothetical protein KJ826_07980 [Proteobacteria bacterium]|nr:hypothetical protein [Pseudomonadota bacterium]
MPDRLVMLMNYNELNRMETVTLDWLGQTATYTYDAAGRLANLDNFNGTVSTYGYDDANRLTSLENRKSGGAVIATYQFELDENGNRTNVIKDEPLTAVAAMENINYTYNTYKNRLLSDGANSFGYDNEGQITTGYGSNYTFDYDHRLKTIGSSYTFTYDATGNRLKAVRNGVETRYIYDAGGNLIAEADSNNVITRYYIYGQGLMAMVTPSDQVYCYHYNAIGSAIAMTDSSKNIVNKYAYDEFGNINNEVEAVSQPFKYVGQHGVMAEPNGFYYMRARFCDPKVGRFVSEDPSGFDGGDVNLYVYVGNNPVLMIDPEGLLSFAENFNRRRQLNGSILTKAIKTTASVAIGSLFNAAAKKEVGLGLGLGELIKNRALIPVLGTSTNTIGNFILSSGFKSIAVGAAFFIGQTVGNIIGAELDTIVDNGSSSFLEKLSFGSGSPNTTYKGK